MGVVSRWQESPGRREGATRYVPTLDSLFWIENVLGVSGSDGSRWWESREKKRHGNRLAVHSVARYSIFRTTPTPLLHAVLPTHHPPHHPPHAEHRHLSSANANSIQQSPAGIYHSSARLCVSPQEWGCRHGMESPLHCTSCSLELGSPI